MSKPLYLVVGKGGSGKDYLVNRCCDLFNMKQVISYTSRPPRFEGEHTHYFTTKEWFMDNIADIPVSTTFGGEYYGATTDQIQEADFYIVDPPGVLMALENIKDRKIVILAVIAPLIDRIERMLTRSDMDEEELQVRLQADFENFGADNFFPGQLGYPDIACPVDHYIVNAEEVTEFDSLEDMDSFEDWLKIL